MKPAEEAVTPLGQLAADVLKELIGASEKAESRVLVEYKQAGAVAQNDEWIGSQEERALQRYVPLLATMLDVSGREFANTEALPTLPFKGYASAPAPAKGQFVFVFDYPTGAAAKKPVSLHSLISSQIKMSLNERFHVAKVISRSLGALHNDRWLHKGIRSHAVKFFFRDDSDNNKDNTVDAPCDTSTPYLTDFSLARPEGEFSASRFAMPTPLIEDNIYRHPQRFGRAQEDFDKVHDVYALGVVLLEIGLWRTAMDMAGEMPAVKQAASAGQAPRVTGEDVKAWFLELARRELEHRMGAAYKNAVVFCLDGGDWSLPARKAAFATEFQRSVVQSVDGVRSKAAEVEANLDWDTETVVGEE